MCIFEIIVIYNHSFFRSLIDENKSKKTYRGLLQTPNRYANRVDSTWRSNGEIDAICFTGSDNLQELFSINLFII